MIARLNRTVDPIFTFGTSLIERVERNETIDYEREHAKIIQLFLEADSREGSSQTWQLAKYALAVWIDEICLTLPWSGTIWWQSHILEMELFQTRLCNVRFFDLAKQAAGLGDRQALEVFYGCVILGFRGMYGTLEVGHQQADNKSHPPTLELWTEEVSALLDQSLTPAYPTGADRIIRGAPPLPGRRSQILWAAVAAMLFVLNVTLATIGWNR